MHIQYLLLGYEDIEVCPRHAACFFNLCRSTHTPYTPLPCVKGEAVRLRCRMRVASLLHKAALSRGIELCTIRCGGLPIVLHRYRCRAGLALGVLLAVLLLQLLGGRLWDVRVWGNSSVPTEQILDQLSQCGLRVGMSLDREEVDSREIENRLLRLSPDIAWVSVNIRGTVARVQIREMQSGESAMEEGLSNLVAAYDGVIESVRLLTGEVVVNVGQQVRAGELLISGVRDSVAQGFVVEGARGEVMAYTEHTEVVQIPLQIEEKVFSGEEICKKSIFFFGKSIKFSKNTGIIGGSCDTIYMMENWTLPTGETLPVGTEITTIRPYIMQTTTRTRQQAYDLALAELQGRLEKSAADALLLKKTVRVSDSETHCTLLCEYQCLRNIAVPLPLEYRPGD